LKEEIWHLVDAFLERRESSATVQRKLEQNDEVHKAKYKAIEDAYGELNTV
jgi:hypothetical protein